MAYEVRVSAKKDELKAAAAVAEKAALRAVIVEVKDTLRATVTAVEALDARLSAVEGRTWRWWQRRL